MKYYILLIVLAILSYAGVFLHPGLIGVDGYHYLNNLCFKTSISIQEPLSKGLMLLFSCDTLAIKCFLCFLFVISVLGVTQIAKLFVKKPWLAGLFTIGLSPLLLFNFYEFENETFSYPLIIWSQYFFFRYSIEKKSQWLLAGLSLVFTAFLFWRGAAYSLIGFILLNPIVLGIVIIGALLNLKQFWYGIIPIEGVMENTTGWIIGFYGLLLGILGVKGKLLIPGIIFAGMALLNQKFAILLIPILAIGVTIACEKYKTLMQILPVAAIIMLLGWNLTTLTQMPNAEHQRVIQEFITECEIREQRDCKNDWDSGYWITYYSNNKIKPSAWGGGNWNQDYNHGLILTWKELKCNLITTGKQLNLYKCTE